MDSSDWSNGIRYHMFGTRPDTEFNDPAAGYAVSTNTEAAEAGAYTRPLFSST